MTDAAPGDVVEQHAIAGTKARAARAGCDDLATRLVSRNHAAVCLGPSAGVLAVDRADVAAADRRRLHAHDDLSVARHGVSYLAKLDAAIAGKIDAAHTLLPARVRRNYATAVAGRPANSQASAIIAASSGFLGTHPSSLRIFSLEATSTAGSPARRGDSTVGISPPVTARAASTTSRTENPAPFPRLKTSRPGRHVASSARMCAAAR